jgi:hypothetical protein
MPSVIEIPAELVHFQLPNALQGRLQSLLDAQDEGKSLGDIERKEAKALVELAEFFSLLQLRSRRVEKTL